MIKGSHSIRCLVLIFFSGLIARGDTIPGVTVERVVLGGSGVRFIVELRVSVEAQTNLVIDEGVNAPAVAANMSGGGVLLGSRIVWTAVLGPGFKRFSYELDILDCVDEFPVGPGTFQVGDARCPIGGEQRGDCEKPSCRPRRRPSTEGISIKAVKSISQTPSTS